MTPPHFRIVMPAEYKGKKHTAAHARIFMSQEGGEETEVTQLWPVISFETVWSIDSIVSLKLEIAGSVEVQYGE
jgi:hypothetical protein